MPMRTMHRVNGLMFQDLLRREEEAREMAEENSQGGDAQAVGNNRSEPRKLGLSFIQAMDIAEDGLRRWREKDHNKKWWRKIDGTPIPNDLLVNIAESMIAAYVVPAAQPPAAPVETERRYTEKEVAETVEKVIREMLERGEIADTRNSASRSSAETSGQEG